LNTQGESFLQNLQKLEITTRELCRVARIIDALDDDEQKQVIHLIMETKVSCAKIGNALRAYGHKVGDNSLWKHRRKTCSCVTIQ